MRRHELIDRGKRTGLEANRVHDQRIAFEMPDGVWSTRSASRASNVARSNVAKKPNGCAVKPTGGEAIGAIPVGKIFSPRGRVSPSLDVPAENPESIAG
jgi:hypothetical protein